MTSAETALFYTFSTIPQTLAGAIALLGAFVLYKLQTLSRDISDEIDVILTKQDIDHIKNFGIVNPATKREFRQFCIDKSKNNSIQHPNGLPTWFDDEVKHITPYYKYKRRLRNSAFGSLAVTVGTITYSLLILPNVTLIIPNGYLKWIYSAGFALAGLCLASYCWVIFYSLATVDVSEKLEEG